MSIIRQKEDMSGGYELKPDFSEEIINYLFYGYGENICWLCLGKDIDDNYLSVYDNVVINTKPYPAAITFEEVLKNLVGYDEVDFSEVPHTICKSCADDFIRNFTFMKKCKLQNVYWQNTVNIANDFFQIDFDTISEQTTKGNSNDKVDTINGKLSETKIKCPHCNIEIHYNNFKDHISVMHKSLKYTPCEKCGKTFINHGSYQVHISKCPRKDKPWKCFLCKEKFKIENDLTEHKQFNCKCRYCGKLLGKETMQSHKPFCSIKMVTKRKKAQFKCKFCGIEYTSRSLLLVHVNSLHRPRDKPCPQCGKLFKTNAAVNDHLRVHKKEKSYTCDYCNKNFVTKRTLEGHIRLHTGIKPYQCFFCTERFVATSRRLEHLRKMHWQPQFECEICRKKFTMPNTLKSHQKRHFSDKNDIMKATKPHNNHNLSDDEDILKTEEFIYPTNFY